HLHTLFLFLVVPSQNLSGGRHAPRYSYDPSIFAFRPLSNAPPCSPLLPAEEPP
ncbi:hypothetical protein M9458_035562, partial [Cirrhinus mrigala]